jgi:hypothetical protein
MSMWIRLEKPCRENSDLEFIAVSIAALAVAVALALNFVDVPIPACNFHRLTGLPCPGCGGTRASLLLSRLDMFGAIEMNPLVAVLGITCGLAAVYSIIVLAFRLQRIRFRFSSDKEKLASWIAFTLIALANWAYLIAVGR